MAPERLLQERSRTWRDVRLDMCAEMVPWSRLDLSRRTFKDERLLPIHLGISPDSLFSPRSRVINWLQCFKKAGRLPERLLLFRCRDCSDVGYELWQSGNSPYKPLLDRSRVLSIRK
ncbi:hypothetical protein B296_00008717 [Ensete ventricosum]|uniref:Uncharacterized protein n=1 Tax=Ensete ventricosum TaxID=4639 RepID=A0A426ZRE8_ENSVE|nr:hypothetical protein B296_00008717 [Ensete ventricosum]